MVLLDALGRTFATLVIKNRGQKSEKYVFVRIVKTLIFLMFFSCFLEVWAPQWSSKWMLQGHMGSTFRPKLVTWAYFLTMFGAGWILESIFEAKVSIFSSISGAYGVGLRQRLAQRRGGRQASRAFASILSTV